jgi:hypothetical protein
VLAKRPTAPKRPLVIVCFPADRRSLLSPSRHNRGDPKIDVEVTSARHFDYCFRASQSFALVVRATAVQRLLPDRNLISRPPGSVQSPF